MTEEQQFPQQKETASQGAVCASSQEVPPPQEKEAARPSCHTARPCGRGCRFHCGVAGERVFLRSPPARAGMVLGLLEDEHYKDVDMDAVYEEIYDAVMPDIFSTYYTPEEYAQRVAESQGHNEGVGISLITDGGSVRSLFGGGKFSGAAGGACRRACMCSAIPRSEAEAFPAQSSSQVTEFIRAQDGEFVLYASYDGSAAADASTAYTLARASYSAAYVVYRDSETSYAFRGENAELTRTDERLSGLDEDTAYIRLDSFDGNCSDEFAACLNVMKERGRSNLILVLARATGEGI